MTTCNGMTIGYARVSTVDQDEALQLDALAKAGCEKVFIDRVSGALGSRPELDRMLEQLRTGDTVVVWRLDRLGLAASPDQLGLRVGDSRCAVAVAD